MLKILRAYGIPEQLVNAIGQMYENTRAKVISPDGETDLFELLAGVLQGDTFAPYLFVIVLDYALRTAIDGREEDLGFHLEKRKSRRVSPEVITDFDFADDFALLSEEIQQAQELLSRVEMSVGKVGLRMNASKTKYMSFNHNRNINIQTNDGTKLKNVTDFKYLGALMESSEKDVKVRKAAAWTACRTKQNLEVNTTKGVQTTTFCCYCGVCSAMHGRSLLSSQKTLMDAILDSSEQYSMSTGSSI